MEVLKIMHGFEKSKPAKVGGGRTLLGDIMINNGQFKMDANNIPLLNE